MASLKSTSKVSPRLLLLLTAISVFFFLPIVFFFLFYSGSSLSQSGLGNPSPISVFSINFAGISNFCCATFSGFAVLYCMYRYRKTDQWTIHLIVLFLTPIFITEFISFMFYCQYIFYGQMEEMPNVVFVRSVRLATMFLGFVFIGLTRSSHSLFKLRHTFIVSLFLGVFFHSIFVFSIQLKTFSIDKEVLSGDFRIELLSYLSLVLSCVTVFFCWKHYKKKTFMLTVFLLFSMGLFFLDIIGSLFLFGENLVFREILSEYVLIYICLMPALGLFVEMSRSSIRFQKRLKESKSELRSVKNKIKQLEETNGAILLRSLNHKHLEFESGKGELSDSLDLNEKDSALKKVQKIVELKNRQIDEMKKFSTNFLANMSHELRTPLNSMLILTELLQDNESKNLSKEELEYVDVILKSGKSLLKLINGILDFSKGESGNLKPEIGAFNILEMCESLWAEISPIANKKNITFEYQIEKNTPDVISSDSQKIKQVLSNLLSNAVKFTEKGSVSLKVELIEDGSSFESTELQFGNVISFCVSDTGIGIQEDMKDIVFEPFKQADDSHTRQYGGTGLGLSLSKEFAHLLKGEIHLDSKEGKGSSFTLYIPELLDLVADKKNEEEPIEIVEEIVNDQEVIYETISDDIDTIKEGDQVILIVCSRDNDLNDFLNTLHGFGIKGIFCHSLENYINLISKYSPIGVVIDLNGYEQTGIEFLHILKNSLTFRHIPVVVSCGSYKNQRALLKVGVIDILEGELLTEGLENAIQMMLAFQTQAKNIIILKPESKLEDEKWVEEYFDSKPNIIDCHTYEEMITSLNGIPVSCILFDRFFGQKPLEEFSDFLKKHDGEIKVPMVLYMPNKLKYDKNKIEALNHSHYCLDIHDQLFSVLNSLSKLLHLSKGAFSSIIEKEIIDSLQQACVFKDKKVLLVDDDMRNTFALSSQLGKLGLSVSMAENGQVAFQSMLDCYEQGHKYDLILLDIEMPVLNGVETLKKIRSHQNLENTPVLLMVPDNFEINMEDLLSAGADDVILGSQNQHSLYSSMSFWLEK